MGMNISDVIVLEKQPILSVEKDSKKSSKTVTKNVNADKLISEALSNFELFQAVEKIRNNPPNDVDSNIIYSLANVKDAYAKKAELSLLKGIAEDPVGATSNIPDELLGFSNLSKATINAPWGNTDTIRNIAEKLGFVIVPFEYLDDRSFKNENNYTQNTIRSFNDMNSSHMDVYVLAPPHHYSPYDHIKSENDLQIYASQPVMQAFMAIQMSIPMFRMLFQQTKNNSQMLESHKKEIQNLETRLVSLTNQVAQLQAQVIEARMRQEAAEAKAIEEARSRSFIEYEPLMFAVKKGAQIIQNHPAMIGPCWGPDFQDIVFAALELKKIESQRKNISAYWDHTLGYGAPKLVTSKGRSVYCY